MVNSPHRPAESPVTVLKPSPDRQDQNRVLPVIAPFDLIPAQVDAVLTAAARTAKLGDRDARNRLFLAIQPKLFQIGRQIRPWMLPSTWERSDLEQEAFIVFAELVDAWSGDTSFTGYLLGHFGWRLRGAVRRARLAQRLPIANAQTPIRVIDDSWACDEMRIALEELASHFSEFERAILLARVRDGDGFGAIAYRLRVSRKTIYRHWTSILMELRQALCIDLPETANTRARPERNGRCRRNVPNRPFHDRR